MLYYLKFTNKHVFGAIGKCIMYTIFSIIIMIFTTSILDSNNLINDFIITFVAFICLSNFLQGIIGWIRIAIKIITIDFGAVGTKELDREMNNEESIYYKKFNLYLTPNYIIMLDKRFKFYNYSDILSMHKCNKKYKIIGKNKKIKIFINNGKTVKFAGINSKNKKQDKIYNEIWNNILSKNPNIETESN